MALLSHPRHVALVFFSPFFLETAAAFPPHLCMLSCWVKLYAQFVTAKICGSGRQEDKDNKFLVQKS
jgi:hypothetical protein